MQRWRQRKRSSTRGCRRWASSYLSHVGTSDSALRRPSPSSQRSSTEPTASSIDTRSVGHVVAGPLALSRLGDIRDDIGGAIVALCSDHMQFVAGQIIPVDGGAYTAL